ncbi:hypothetical protein GA0061103_0048 [Rhizobium multihospitium]|uniref:Uncharacterized protein n=1 Tax=Rhizobium multihospitium TaxID=410764 RepID=A0A1C3X403_9HYPH|nr:hypothetical protein GA0061103_0048 [Rhizobium multihospitium]
MIRVGIAVKGNWVNGRLTQSLNGELDIEMPESPQTIPEFLADFPPLPADKSRNQSATALDPQETDGAIMEIFVKYPRAR